MKLFVVVCTVFNYEETDVWVLGVFDSRERGMEAVEQKYGKTTLDRYGCFTARYDDHDDVDIDIQETELNQTLERED